MSSDLKKASVGPVFLGSIITFLIFGLLIVIWFRLAGKNDSYDDQRAVVRAAKLDQLQKDNHEKLSAYAWVSKDKGVVQLPIDRAMEVVVADLKARPVKTSAVKVEVPYPAGLQPVPAATAPVAPAATGTAAPASAAPAVPAPVAIPATPALVPAAPSTVPAALPVPAAVTTPAAPAAPAVATTPAP